MHVLALVLYTVLIAKKLINAFLAEADRDRAPWDKFADLVICLAHIGGEVAKELEPARKLINSIARLLGRAKEFEDSAPKLPPPEQSRRIPGPPKGTNGFGRRGGHRQRNSLLVARVTRTEGTVSSA